MVSTQSISVELPDDLYKRIQEIAERNDRSVESVLRESLEVMFGEESAEAESSLDRLETYRDDQLWAVVYQRLAWPRREHLRELTERGKQGDLTPSEQAELEALLDRVDHYTLIRSEALRLLKQRGHDIDRDLKLGIE
jgi:predicted DNA-binding protein